TGPAAACEERGAAYAGGLMPCADDVSSPGGVTARAGVGGNRTVAPRAAAFQTAGACPWAAVGAGRACRAIGATAPGRASIPAGAPTAGAWVPRATLDGGVAARNARTSRCIVAASG